MNLLFGQEQNEIERCCEKASGRTREREKGRKGERKRRGRKERVCLYTHTPKEAIFINREKSEKHKKRFAYHCLTDASCLRDNITSVNSKEKGKRS